MLVDYFVVDIFSSFFYFIFFFLFFIFFGWFLLNLRLLSWSSRSYWFLSWSNWCRWLLNWSYWFLCHNWFLSNHRFLISRFFVFDFLSTCFQLHSNISFRSNHVKVLIRFFIRHPLILILSWCIFHRCIFTLSGHEISHKSII
jgi:hypothetical protein